MFTSNTARMQAARVAELQELTANDAIPGEMICGETTRIDSASLTGLIEKSAGIAVGTPKQGLPRLEPEILVAAARGSSGELDIEEVAAVVDAVAEPVVAVEAPPARVSRLRDILIGGAISVAAMAAWYCATQL
jgi:hypothetical protein